MKKLNVLLQTQGLVSQRPKGSKPWETGNTLECLIEVNNHNYSGLEEEKKKICVTRFWLKGDWQKNGNKKQN